MARIEFSPLILGVGFIRTHHQWNCTCIHMYYNVELWLSVGFVCVHACCRGPSLNISKNGQVDAARDGGHKLMDRDLYS